MRTDSGHSSMNVEKKKKKKQQQQQQQHKKKDESEEEGASRVESQTIEDYSPKKKKKDKKKNRTAATAIADDDGELCCSAVESFDLGSVRDERKVEGGRNETKGKRKNAAGSDLETVSEITYDDGKAKERRKGKEKGGDGRGRRKDEKSRLGDVAEEDGDADLVSDGKISSVELGKKKKKRIVEDDAKVEALSKNERHGDLGDDVDVGRSNKRKKGNAVDTGDEGRGTKKKRSFENINYEKKNDENAERSKTEGKEDIADDRSERQEMRKRDTEDNLDVGVSSKKRRKIAAKDDIDSKVPSEGKRNKRKDDANTGADDAILRKTRRKGNVEGDVDGVQSKRKKKLGVKDVDGRTKKKSVKVASDSENDQAAKKSRKVRFSDEVEVFPLPKGGKDASKADEDSLVQGKRFTPEEDELVRDAVLSFIKVHDLGENGVDILMNCRQRTELKGCWKEIGAFLPWRPYKAVYYRAHILFEGDGKRKWDSEEYEILRRHYEKHGSDWKKLAVQLGKHRFHIKDAWRRIKLPNVKSGHWSQDEYQNLFDLVNKDLCIRALTEKVDKHGMLRDNIGWEAISQSLATRTNVTCCQKWYDQLASPMIVEGLWNNSDDYRLLQALVEFDASCLEDVDWDYLLEHRSGDICLRRWKEMSKHVGGYKEKPFTEQVEVLASRYSPDMLEAVEAYESQ